MKPQRILVLGGTGFVGQQVCERLVAQGQHVTVATRRATSARNVQALPLVQVVEANVHSPDELARIVSGHDAVVNLVAILHGTPAAFDHVHVQLPTQIARACVQARVPRLVHVSAIGCGAAAPSNYLQSKTRGEAALTALTADGPTQLAIVRPSVIFGAGDKFLNLFAKLLAIFPVMPLAGAKARFQPVWVGDVADLLVKLACGHRIHSLKRYKNSSNQITHTLVEATGPDVVTLRELVTMAGRLSMHPRPIIGLPDALARIQARLMELAPGEPLMSRDNLASMRVPNIASGELPNLRDCGIVPSSLDAIAPTYLGGTGPRTHLDGMRKWH